MNAAPSSPAAETAINTHFRTFNRPMGMAAGGGVQEIFALQAPPDMLFPELLQEGEHLAATCALPEDALRDVDHGSARPAVSPGAAKDGVPMVA